MKIIGYHNTESDNVEDIITNGFKYRKMRNIGLVKEYIFLIIWIWLSGILIC